MVPLLVLILSIIAHEVAHGVAAYIHGDETAYRAGRLTLNPLPHIDLFGSIIIPILSVMFTSYAVGYAKPVPYNPYNLKGKYAEFWVASAGVLTNFLIALVAVAVYKVLPSLSVQKETLQQIFFYIVWTNISLGVFNLLPLPPFDGMSIIQSFSARANRLSLAFAQNPLYMIVILVVATTIFSAVSPYIYAVVYTLLQ